MEEKTNLFINIEDINGKQILGTVVFYGWGYGKVMLESALHIALNIDGHNENFFPEANNRCKHLASLYTILEKTGVLRPKLACGLRYSIYKNVGKYGEFSMFPEEEIIRDNVLEEYKDKSILSYVEPETEYFKVDMAYQTSYKNFFEQCLDNDFGLMFINIKTENRIESDCMETVNAAEIKFGFGITEKVPSSSSEEKEEEVTSPFDYALTEDFSEETIWYPSTFEEYVGQFGDKDQINEDFIEDYKLTLEANGIKMMSPEELKMRRGK